MKTKIPVIFLFTIFLILPLVLLFPNKTADLYKDKTALLIIDVQKFYFPQGSMPLKSPEAACENIFKILKKFRADKLIVVHIRHNAKVGAEIHEKLIPIKGEKIISKNYANSFKETGLLKYLEGQEIKQLVICGMQTHMCVEAATRAASDLGFKCILVHDACATRDLKFQDQTIKAKDVHNSTISSLARSYAKVISTTELLKENKDSLQL